MSKLVGIRTYERFRSLWEDNAIDEFSLNFIIDTGQLYTHGIFINGAVFGTAANGAVPLSIAGTTNTLALSTHTHSNYLEKNADIDISSYKIKSGDKDLLFYSGGSLYLGNTTSPTYISGNNLYSVRGTNVYEILDTSNFSVSNTLPTGYTYNNTAYIKYGNNSHQIDYVKRINTSQSFDYLNTYTQAGTNLLNGVQYGYITLYTDNVYTNPSWAQLRINIPGKSIQYRTSADANTWINLDQPNIPQNALNVAGIVSAPSSTTTNKVWKTDGSGNPAWRDELSYTFSNLKFQQISGTDLMTYNTQAVRTILAGSNVSFSHNDGVLTINAQSPTYGVVSKTQAGLAPQLPNETTTTKFLRQDGTWATPTYTSDTNTWREIKVNGTQKRGTAITSGDLDFINGSNTAVEWTSDNKLKINSTWTAWKGATDSANGTAGYMPAPTSAQRGQFLRGDGSWVSLNNYSLPTASNSTLGGVKTGAAITDTTGYTAVAIKDGVIYYKDTNTTYSFSNLQFQQTSGTNLMTYNSQAVRTVLAGSNITFTHSNNVLTIAAKDTTYSTVSKTAAGLCPTLPNETTTTKYLRQDGTWAVPPDNNTWKAANASQEGYVPKSTANKILRANGDGALYWGDDANTTYTFYNLQFQNSGGTTVDTYKPTTSPTKTLKAGANVTISAASNVITIASTNTWNANAVGVAGYVAAPTKAANANMTWQTDAEGIPAWRASNNHSHSYLPLSGGIVTGPITINSSVNNNYNEGLRITRAGNSWAGITFGSTGTAGAPTDGWFVATNPSKQFIISPDTSVNTTGLTLNKDGNALWRNNIIYHAGNLPAYPTKASWNYNDMYVSSLTTSGNYLRWVKNGSNNDITIPYATSAGSATDVPFPYSSQSHYGSTSSTSYYKININSETSWMMSFIVRVYQGYNSYDIRFSGYNYGGNHWYSPSASLLDSTTSSITVYFGYDANWKLWVAIPGASYSGVSVYNAVNGYTQVNLTEKSLFTVSAVNSLGGTIQSTQTIYRPLKADEAASSVAWSNVTSKPDTATRWPSWSEVTGKPSTFAPALPARLTPHGQDTSSNRNANTTCLENGFYWVNAGTLPSNVGDANIITVNANTSYAHQLAFKFSGKGTTGTAYDGKDIYTRIYNNGSWLSWYTILTSGNSSVSKSGETLTVNIGGTSQSLTNTTYSGSSTVTLSGTTFSLTKANVTTALGYTPPTTNSTYNFSGTTFRSGYSSGEEHNCNNAWENGHYYYTANGPSGLGNSTTDGALYVQSYNSSWVGQIAQDYRNGRLWVRGKNNGTWQSWVRIANYNEVALASHTHSFSQITDGTSSSTNSGWSRVLSNTYGGSQKSILYMCHGGGYGMHLRGYSTSSSVYMLEIYNSSKLVFAVYGDGHSAFGGNVEAPNYFTVSDRTKKQNISSFSEHIRKFQMKDTEKWHYGVIAQEVPEMFRNGKEGNMIVNYNSVLSYYVGCLENSVAGLEDAKRCLENKVKELEEKIKVLETKQNKQI